MMSVQQSEHVRQVRRGVLQEGGGEAGEQGAGSGCWHCKQYCLRYQGKMPMHKYHSVSAVPAVLQCHQCQSQVMAQPLWLLFPSCLMHAVDPCSHTWLPRLT